MTDPTVDPAALGWRPMRTNAMPSSIGLPWAKRADNNWHYALLTINEHANPQGAVHGGILMTFADHTLGIYAWEAAQRAPCVTIQMNTHFLAAVTPGDFVELRGEVTRATRGLVFVRGILAVGDKDVAAIDGIWRVLRARPTG
jgi:acyl-coenzyme A thioesterase PaaI-like protein